MRSIYRLPQAQDGESVQELCRQLRLPEAIARVLVARGFADPDSARIFLRPRLSHLHDPWLMRGMEEAVDRLSAAIDREEPILVHGDYDVDGVCGSALLVRALRRLGARTEPFVPNRLKDGYDFGPAGLEAAVRSGARLVLTCDCGISAHDTIAAARDRGIDVIVTDHHTPPPELPPATAVLDPHRPDETYPERVLCGAGVAFKLLQALYERRGRPADELYRYLDLVAIPTVADLVPLTGENRVLTRYGLRVLKRSRNPGLRALLDVSGLSGRRIHAGQIAFVLGPRLNAVGRMGEALRGIELLLTEDDARASELAKIVDAENRTRQEIDRRTFEEAKEMLAATFDEARDRAIVLASEDWHPGVIGIVASRVVELLYRPTVLIALDGASGRGSGRSIPGYHLYEALKACAPHLERYGGHRAAAGLEIRRDRIEAFQEALNRHASELLSEDDLRPVLRVDLEVPLAALTADHHRILAHFGPFGQGNPTPVFLARNVRLRGQPEVVGVEHLRVRFDSSGCQVTEGIGFRLANELERLGDADTLDIAFRLRAREWQGVEYLQAEIVDLRPAEMAWAASES